MSLVEQFKLLIRPEEGNFSAVKIGLLSNHRVAINDKNFPSILLACSESLQNLNAISLQYLKVNPNLSCTISEDGYKEELVFTVISFQSNDILLQEYFLKISEVLIASLPPNPSDKDILNVIYKYLEVLRSLSEVPRKSIQGLWAEVFTILESQNIVKMLQYWHYNPNDKFDFDASTFKLEVKSSSNNQRVHTFSMEQLTPAIPIPVFIISILTRTSSTGVSLQALRDRIVDHLEGQITLIQKLDLLIAYTLGSSLQDVLDISFDYDLALESMLCYNSEDIPKISQSDIPPQISDIRFKVNLTDIKSTSFDVNSIINIL
jgi:hypothetical protein